MFAGECVRVFSLSSFRFSTRAFSVHRVSLGSSRLLDGTDLDAEDREDRPSRKLINRYKQLNSWKSKQNLIKQLTDNVLYHNPEDKSGLVALNKPYGLPINPAEDIPHSLSTLLKNLAEDLQVGDLEILKSVDRYCSGVVLLSSKPETREKLKKIQRRIRCNRLLTDSYLAVVTGHANLKLLDDFRVKMKEFPKVDNPLFSKVHKEPVILSGVSSRQSRLKHEESRRHVSCQSVNRSSLVPLSLIKICPSSVKNHLIRVWLAERGYPVLGDSLYDYRVRTVLGQKIVRGPEYSPANRTQILPTSTLNMFGIGKGEVWRLPTFLHHWRTILPGWGGKGKDLTIYAPPPEHFLQTLSEAKIEFSMEELIKEDSIATFASEPKKKTKNVEILEY